VKKPPLRIIVTDANVLINLIHVARLDLFADLPDLEIVVPDHVRDEIRAPHQRTMLDSALNRGLFRIALITDPKDVDLFVDFTTYLGRGEAACLVLAVRHGWTVASDEKRRFRREAARRIGDERIIGTADLFIHAIRAGLVTLEEADADKALLEESARAQQALGESADRELLELPRTFLALEVHRLLAAPAAGAHLREEAPRMSLLDDPEVCGPKKPRLHAQAVLLLQHGELTEVQMPTAGAEFATAVAAVTRKAAAERCASFSAIRARLRRRSP
jgi:predicted nucleic acid-binding protein